MHPSMELLALLVMWSMLNHWFMLISFTGWRLLLMVRHHLKKTLLPIQIKLTPQTNLTINRIQIIPINMKTHNILLPELGHLLVHPRKMTQLPIIRYKH